MEQQQPQRESGQVTAATLTTATTGLVVWIVDGAIFRNGEVPGEVYVFLQVGVPIALGFLGAEVAYRRARRRAEG